MKVLLDTNVILDVWLAREPFWRDSARLLGKVEGKEIQGVICPTTITTLHYLGKKVLGEKKARMLLKGIMDICKIGEISKRSFSNALESKVGDFEDAVIESVAHLMAVDYIATRNVKDFRRSKVEAQEPPFFL
jgi:predicted nucleic acid-binding protein